MFDKIRAIAKTFYATMALAALTAGVQYSGKVDWPSFGPIGVVSGVTVGAGLAWGVGYYKKELQGYGTPEEPKLTKDNDV